MTPGIAFKSDPDVTITYNDKKGVKTEGWIDSKDTVRVEFGAGGTACDVSTEKFLSDSAFDKFGSPQERLALLKGGGSCSHISDYRSLFVSSRFYTCHPAMVPSKIKADPIKAGPWANNVVDKAEKDYQTRERQKYAEGVIAAGSSYTDALREALVQDPSLKKSHLTTTLSKKTGGPAASVEFVMDTARAFLRDHPGWTWSDLAEFNRAMGNVRTANQLEQMAKDGTAYAILIARPDEGVIELPTGKAADILKK